MNSVKQYRQASAEARLSLCYARERLRDMASAGEISGELFKERQRYLARCIDEWCELSEARLDEFRGRQQRYWRQ